MLLLPTPVRQCCLLITFANSLDPDQSRQNVLPDLDPSFLTLWCYSRNNFFQKSWFLKKSAENKKSIQNDTTCKELIFEMISLFSGIYYGTMRMLPRWTMMVIYLTISVKKMRWRSCFKKPWMSKVYYTAKHNTSEQRRIYVKRHINVDKTLF